MFCILVLNSWSKKLSLLSGLVGNFSILKSDKSIPSKSRNYSGFIIKFPYNACSHWLKQRALSEIRERVDDIKLAFKFLRQNLDKYDPSYKLSIRCATQTKSI